jgi:hypothetical protein
MSAHDRAWRKRDCKECGGGRGLARNTASQSLVFPETSDEHVDCGWYSVVVALVLGDSAVKAAYRYTKTPQL